jgi:hypothetical protein
MLILSSSFFCIGQATKHDLLPNNTGRSAERDSMVTFPQKSYKSAPFYKIAFTSGVLNFNHKNSSLIFQSGPGAGIEGVLGFKIKKHFSACGGLNYSSFHLNKKLLDRSIEQAFTDYDLRLIDTSSESGRLKKTALFAYLSYWLYRPSFVLELYTKIAYAGSTLQLSNIVYRRANFSNYSEYFLLNKKQGFGGFLPSAGLCFNKKINRILYIYLSAEYGYYFNRFNTLQADHYGSDGRADMYKLSVPQMAHVFQGSIGLLFRSFNRVKKDEKLYEQQQFEQINKQNN